MSCISQGWGSLAVLRALTALRSKPLLTPKRSPNQEGVQLVVSSPSVRYANHLTTIQIKNTSDNTVKATRETNS
ncbi:hypothetical protein HaLaN_18828, partial [Haematococcus lacustris]